MSHRTTQLFENVIVIDNVREVGDGVWPMSTWLKIELFIWGNVKLVLGGNQQLREGENYAPIVCGLCGKL